MRRTLLGIGAAEGPGARPLVLLHRIGEGRGRCAIVYARVPPYRTHRTHSNVPTTYTPCSPVKRTSYTLPTSSSSSSSSRCAPPLCFFVQAKIINGQTEADTLKCQPRDNDEARTSSPPSLSCTLFPSCSSDDDQRGALTRA